MALMLVGPSKCLKQIIQIKLKRVKNPNTSWLFTSLVKDLKSGLLGTSPASGQSGS